MEESAKPEINKNAEEGNYRFDSGRQQTVKDLCEDERPREKAMRHGCRMLSNAELWALVLRSGMPGRPITTLCSQLMADVRNSLLRLFHLRRNELMSVPGIGEAKMLQVEAVMELCRRFAEEKDRRDMEDMRINGPESIYQMMRARMEMEDDEGIWIMFVKQNNEVIDIQRVSHGGSRAAVFDLKKILRMAMDTRLCEALVMCHNHPSGNLSPSAQDDHITKRLVEGAGYLDLRVLDHLIISTKGYYSYFERGRL